MSLSPPDVKDHDVPHRTVKGKSSIAEIELLLMRYYSNLAAQPPFRTMVTLTLSPAFTLIVFLR